MYAYWLLVVLRRKGPDIKLDEGEDDEILYIFIFMKKWTECRIEGRKDGKISYYLIMCVRNKWKTLFDGDLFEYHPMWMYVYFN